MNLIIYLSIIQYYKKMLFRQLEYNMKNKKILYRRSILLDVQFHNNLKCLIVENLVIYFRIFQDRTSLKIQINNYINQFWNNNLIIIMFQHNYRNHFCNMPNNKIIKYNKNQQTVLHHKEEYLWYQKIIVDLTIIVVIKTILIECNLKDKRKCYNHNGLSNL